MKILTFSSLYPNAAQPNHGVFVENRLRHLTADGRVTSQVIAPVPWFPWRNPRFGSYARLAAVPRRENRHGLDIEHPRYPVIPKLGMSLAPLLMYAWSKPAVARLLDSGYDFDLIDAHYFYPDGVAAAMLGRHFKKPVTITARGTDINLIPQYPLPRRMLRWAAGRAAACITVCQALKDAMIDLGIDPNHIRVLRNGVDLELFRPCTGDDFRRELGVEPPILLSVGGLIPRKGHDFVIKALPKIPNAVLLIAGDGPEKEHLQNLARILGIESRVRLLGPVPHNELRQAYSAADVLILASDREGWPNVLLEAMACGTPAAATDAWGIPEVVAEPAAGRLIPARDPEAIAKTVRDLLADPPDRADTRAYAERFSWDETTEGQIALFKKILAEEA